MATTFIVKKAKQGTTDKEIAKAKRIFKLAVTRGEFPSCEEVTLKFTDFNNTIKCEYWMAEGEGVPQSLIGEKVIEKY